MQVEGEYINEYKVQAEIDGGAQGQVYLASRNQSLYAAKVYMSTDEPEMKVIMEENYNHEVRLLENLKHENLINLVSYDRSAKVRVSIEGDKEVRRSVIIMEFAEKGELIEYVMERSLSVSASKRIMKMLLEAIRFMDEKGVAHRDIKPDNTLFSNDYQVKLGDFGHATISKNMEGYIALKETLGIPCKGTKVYRLPAMEFYEQYIGIEADIYSVGMTLFVTMTGCFPYGSFAANDPLYRHIKSWSWDKYWKIIGKQLPNPSILTKEFTDLMETIFIGKGNPFKRPSLADLLENNWLNEGLGEDADYRKEMSQIYRDLTVKNKKKQKIEKIKLQFFNHEANENINHEGQRGESCEFLKFYNEYLDFNTESILPLKEREFIPLVKYKPAFLLAWVRNFLSEHFTIKEKDFPKKLEGKLSEEKGSLNCFTGSIVPELASFDVDKEENKLSVVFELEFEMENGTEVEEFDISGCIVKATDSQKIGIKWNLQENESFYASVLRRHINDNIKILVD